MPIPLIPVILGASALLTGGAGVVKGAKAISDNADANDVNERAQEIYNKAKRGLENARVETGDSLTKFGKKKMSCCQYTLKKFITLFRQVKNIELASSAGIDELSKFKIDKQEVIRLEELSVLATSMAAGTATGAIAGSVVAFGAYGAASALATASTGTAIAGLSGVAATNATLAFFGGGSLAAGGFGVAGGTMVLGGVVAGPALLILGAVMGAKASAKLDNAYSNLAEARKASAELNLLITACVGIKERCNLFTKLLIKVDMLMNKMNTWLQEILNTEGADYNGYTDTSKDKVKALIATAKAFKALIDTPLLDENGKLLDYSWTIAQSVQKQIAK